MFKIFLLIRRQVSYEEGESLAKENGLMFLEVSAKTAHNVEEAFTLSSKNILKNIEDSKSEIQKVIIYFNYILFKNKFRKELK